MKNPPANKHSIIPNVFIIIMDWPANANGFDTINGFGLILLHAITGLRLVDEFR
jgi:hypothetical protein